MVFGETIEEVEVRAGQAIEIIENWMCGKKLALAHHKTEVMMISNRKAVQHSTITAREVTIASKRELKHLGVMIDDRLNFNSHVDYACEKATKAITALTRIMSNSSAISSSKANAYRLMAMRVASAYRTISMDAVCAIVGMIPLNILLEEDCSASNINPENIVQEMCKNENTWNEIGRAVTQFMKSLQRKWREDQRISGSDH
ncbi:uncharacterized protein LOC134221819 [Armigeres subalbatus]|uniref:uncharacterized protein LOC134221819 n=1 Tax=Armigeres subalbatus TaxID=124917 RepID=UPI002ED2FF38